MSGASGAIAAAVPPNAVHAASSADVRWAETASDRGLLVCPACSLVSRAPRGSASDAVVACPRCDADVHLRKPDSVRRTWAFIVAAFVLYIPANMFPIMDTSSLFNAQQDTILSGVLYLWSTGSWVTALIVFIASIVTPLTKLISLSLLTLSVQRRWTWRPLLRTQIYRAVTLVGRWSMLDIFVVTVLVALVQLQSVAVITAGPGALAFGAVVVLTMFAAYSFDPRLIWDPLRKVATDE